MMDGWMDVLYEFYFYAVICKRMSYAIYILAVCFVLDIYLLESIEYWWNNDYMTNLALLICYIIQRLKSISLYYTHFYCYAMAISNPVRKILFRSSFNYNLTTCLKNKKTFAWNYLGQSLHRLGNKSIVWDIPQPFPFNLFVVSALILVSRMVINNRIEYHFFIR